MFTKRELALLRDDYFELIRIEDQFVEVMSKNTGHCWNVFKNTFEATMKVELYHKHGIEKPHYHKQRTCLTVVDAVKTIKDHDEYVLERQKEKATLVSDKKERCLTVTKMSGYKYRPTPSLRLTGAWLEEWGFAPGNKVNVVCEGDGKMVITTIN